MLFEYMTLLEVYEKVAHYKKFLETDFRGVSNLFDPLRGLYLRKPQI